MIIYFIVLLSPLIIQEKSLDLKDNENEVNDSDSEDETEPLPGSTFIILRVENKLFKPLIIV
jgi:hypothetical protein